MPESEWSDINDASKVVVAMRKIEVEESGVESIL